MASTYSSRLRLARPANNDPGWDATLNADLDLLDAQNAVGAGAVVLAEIPSSSLNVKVAAVDFRKSDGTLVSYAGTASQAMTTAATNYLYLTDAGVLAVNTTGFPAATFHVRLATVVAGATTISSIADSRVPFVSGGANGNTVYLALAGGTFADAGGVVTVGLGATNGTKVGATGDKLGFLGATPVGQQANTVDLVVLLSTLGLRAAGGNPPLNLGTGALTCGPANIGGLTTLGDGQNVAAGTTTGTKVGTATTQKLGFWGAAPVVQPAGANQAALTDSTGGTASTTLSAVGATNSGDVSGAINSNLASLARLLNQLRSDLVAAGLIKGSA